MALLDELFDPRNSGAISQIAQQVGISDAQARSALQQLTPALSRGIQRNAATEDGFAALSRALEGGNHGRYLDDPRQLGNAVDDGNGILGHIFGSKEVSREVAGRVGQQTGIGADLIKQLLPLVASLVMGALAKNAAGGGAFGGGPAQAGSSGMGGGLGDILGSVLGGGQPGQRPGAGGGLGDILGSVLGGGQQPQASGGGLGGILGSMLDANKDGSPFDDILDMVTKGRR
jgi:hypothetical protein